MIQERAEEIMNTLSNLMIDLNSICGMAQEQKLSDQEEKELARLLASINIEALAAIESKLLDYTDLP